MMNLNNQIQFLREIHKTDLFSECNAATIPAPLDPENVRSAIIMRCGLLEPAYSEPSVMHQLTNLWFHTNSWNFQHLVNIILAEYSPIENTDKYSEHTNERTGSGGRTLNVTDSKTDTHSGTDTRTTQHSGKDERDEAHTGSDDTEHTVSAYNSSGYQPDNKETLEHGEIINDDLTYGHRIVDGTEYGHRIGSTGSRTETSSDNSSGTESYIEHTHGNIGVTTNQTMIEEELQLLQRFNVYDWIAAKYERELCLQVY